MQHLFDQSQAMQLLKEIAPFLTGGLAGAILTLLTKFYSERRRRKLIRLDVSKQKYSLPEDFSQERWPSEDLSVSYKGQEYSHLGLYSVRMENYGHGGITGQKLVFVFPKQTSILKEFKIVSVPTIKFVEEDGQTEEATTKTYSFERIEANDSVALCFLVDCEAIDQIKCLPRGVDDVGYIIESDQSKTEIEQTTYKLLLYSAAFVLFGAVDIIGNVLRALIFIMAIPTIMRLLSLVSSQRRRSAVENEIGTFGIHDSRNSIVLVGKTNVVKFEDNTLRDGLTPDAAESVQRMLRLSPTSQGGPADRGR